LSASAIEADSAAMITSEIWQCFTRDPILPLLLSTRQWQSNVDDHRRNSWHAALTCCELYAESHSQRTANRSIYIS